MKHNQYSFILLTLFISIFFFKSPYAFARWEAGAKAGFDSNIDRAIDGGTSDSYLTGFLSIMREPDEESNIDWSLNLALEGAGYVDSKDLNYGMATVSPAIIFYPNTRWRIDISPFFQAIGVSDTEQSAVAFGGKISIRQSWNYTFYTGEYFVYTDNRADVEIYSYKDKAAGIYAGMNWTDAFWSEIGYEFSRGDSFRAVEDVSTTQVVTSQIVTSQGGSGGQGGTGQGGTGQGGTGQGSTGSPPRYSKAFNAYIISEPVDRQTIGINMGYQFTRQIFSFINYAYTSYKGDAGTSKSHTVAIGLGYNF